jgi:FMN reductase
MKVAVISGSVVGSKTRKATTELAEKIKALGGHELEYIDLKEYDFPFSDGRNYLDYGGSTSEALKKIMDAEVIFIGTPIFQASIPGTLKNLFDLLPADGFRDKTVGLVVTAGSLRHYLVAEQQLKPILSYMKANIVQSYVYITDLDFSKEGIASDDILLRLDNLIDSTFNVASAQQKVIQEYSDSFGF